MTRSEQPGFYRRRGKRVLDFILAGLSLIVLAPILALVATVLFVFDGPPVLFRQARPGLDEREFVLLKFRTMRPEAGTNQDDAARITGFGRFLRRTSLDELPELWNVVRGQMSLVGPRPLLSEYLDLYSSEQRRRHEVRPGLTGWAQIHGRNALGWEEKFAHDLWYVENVSLRLDLAILARTAAQVVAGRGISAANHATMPKFEGAADAGQRPVPEQSRSMTNDEPRGPNRP